MAVNKIESGQTRFQKVYSSLISDDDELIGVDNPLFVQITDGTDAADVTTNVDRDTNIDGSNGLNTNAMLFGRVSDSIVKNARLDASTEAQMIIDYAHHETHAGSSFNVCDIQNVSSTTIKYQITTPNTTKYSHMLFDIECTGEMQIIVTEGSDRVDGTALLEINRNRVGTPPTAGTIVTLTPTGGTTDGATIIFCKRSGSTGVGSKTVSAGSSRGNNEYILKPNTKYVVSIETFADVYVTLDIDWYEHTDRN